MKIHTPMLRSRHKDLHPLLKIVEWLIIMAVCVLPVFGIWHVLPINHASTGSLLLLQAMQAVALFILPPFVVAYLWSDRPLQWLHLTTDKHTPLDPGLACLTVGIILTAVPLINSLVALNGLVRLPASMSGLEQMMQQMETQAEQLLQGFLTYRNGAWWVLVLNLVLLAILPAIGEELTFRGVLQSFFGNRHVAVWVTAFVFAFVHFQFYGFIPRMLLGVVLGYALVWSGRIGYSMIMHATNNALSVIVFWLSTYVLHIPQAELDSLGTGHTWWLTAACTPVMLLLMYLYHKRASAKKE